jgi:hypothetical protein
MAYNKAKDVSAGYISPQHQKWLQRLVSVHKRTKRGMLEWLIEEAMMKPDMNPKTVSALPGVGQGGALGDSDGLSDAQAQLNHVDTLSESAHPKEEER